MRFQACDYDAEKGSSFLGRSSRTENSEQPELGNQQARSQSWAAEEAEGELAGEGPQDKKQKVVTCTHVLLCHHAFGSADRGNTIDRHQACCPWHSGCVLRHQGTSARLPCQTCPGSARHLRTASFCSYRDQISSLENPSFSPTEVTLKRDEKEARKMKRQTHVTVGQTPIPLLSHPAPADAVALCPHSRGRCQSPLNFSTVK